MSKVTIDADGNGLADTQLEYEYDDQGIRTAQTKTVDGNADGDFDDPEDTSERTEYLVDHHNHTGYAQILEEWLNGALSKSYTLGLDVLAQALASGAVHFFPYDGHGSTRGLVARARASSARRAGEMDSSPSGTFLGLTSPAATSVASARSNSLSASCSERI